MGTTTKTKGQVKLFGIGKYSFLALSTPVLDFEAVLTRTSKEMEQIVTNLSPVIARFAVHRVEAWYNGHDSVYTISPMEGAIPPNSALSLKVLAFHNLHTSASLQDCLLECYLRTEDCVAVQALCVLEL